MHKLADVHFGTLEKQMGRHVVLDPGVHAECQRLLRRRYCFQEAACEVSSAAEPYIMPKFKGLFRIKDEAHAQGLDQCHMLVCWATEADRERPGRTEWDAAWRVQKVHQSPTLLGRI